jgi:hypothetical protein
MRTFLQKSASGSLAKTNAPQANARNAKRGLHRKAPRPLGHDSRISPYLPTAAPPVIQRKPGDGDASKREPAPHESDSKAELEFHSTIGFRGPDGGTSSSGPAEEGFTVLGFQWTVWNSGFTVAPEHVDRVTVYNANRCSGCRDEKDEILSMDVTVPATAGIAQTGEREFRYVAISPLIGATLRAGHYDVYVDLDVHDEVEEINEDNNTIFTSFYVKPRAEPDTDEE